MRRLTDLTETELRQLDGLLSSYEVFQLTYRDNPSAFVRHCINFRDGENATEYQLEALDRLSKNKRLAMRSCRGAGKTTTVAFAILWFALTNEGYDWKVFVTANVFRLIKNQIFAEVRKWAGRLNWKKIGREPFTQHELLQVSLKLATGAVTSATATTGEMIEGIHADRLLVIADETKSINDEILDSIEGSLDEGSYYLMTSTPGLPSGRFYDINQHKAGYEEWDVLVVDVDRVIAAGRRTEEWKEQRKRQWGIGSPLYQTHVLAQFSDLDNNGLISLTLVENSNDLWQQIVDSGYKFPKEDLRTLGVDVGGGGNDPSVISMVYRTEFNGTPVVIVNKLLYRNFENSMQLVALIETLADHNVLINIDSIGVGLGAADRLLELGYKVQKFVASEKTKWMDRTNTWRFQNKRSAAWWNYFDMLNETAVLLALPVDDRLLGDTLAPQYKEISGGVIAIESKDSIKKRLRRSTDAGDAVIHGLWEMERQEMDETTGKYGIFL